MRENKVKRALNQGKVSLGTMIFEFNTTGMARLTAATGAEFAIYDMEHTGWDIETIRMLMSTACTCDLVPLVRVPTAQYHFIARVLDVGAMGFMVPMVETVEQAKLIAQSAKYPPAGRRGAAFGFAHDDYQTGDILGTMHGANQEGLVIAQIETGLGLENAEQIAAVEGIDVLWIGQFDLSNFLGIPGQFEHPRFQRALGRVLEACQRYGKAAGYMVTSVDEGCRLIDRGFRIIAYWGDMWVYQQGMRQGFRGMREQCRLQ